MYYHSIPIRHEIVKGKMQSVEKDYINQSPWINNAQCDTTYDNAQMHTNIQTHAICVRMHVLV